MFSAVSIVYLLDEELGISGQIGQISENLAEEIASACCEMPYRKAAEEISELTGQTISAMCAWEVTQGIGERVEEKEKEDAELAKKHEGVGQVEKKVIFEEHDGTYINLQGEDRKKQGEQKEIKVAIAYSGAKKTGKDRYNLIDKVAYATFESTDFYWGKEGVIASYYNVDEIEQRIVNGDGAGWIKKSVTDEDVHYQLDRYHRNRAVGRTVADAEKRQEIRNLLYNNEIDTLLGKLQDYVDKTANIPEKQTENDSYKQLLSYYSNNKEGLIPYRERGLELPPPEEGTEYRGLGAMESNIFTLIGFRMKGRRANWSINGGNHLAKLLTLKVTDRLSEFMETINGVKQSQRYTDTIPTLSPPLSAAKVPDHSGKGWDGFMKATIPSSLKWMKDIFQMKILE